MSSPSPDLVFRGIDGTECARFLRAIKRHAIHEGKDRNNQWILAYCKSCFSGRALRWLLSLDLEVQDDWTALQLAMLDQYPDDEDDPTVPSAPQAFAPPLVPNPSLTSKTGRIRIRRQGASLSQDSYVSGTLSSSGALQSTESSADALVVCAPSSGGPHDIRLSEGAKWLGVHWLPGSSSIGRGSHREAVMCINTQSGVDLPINASSHSLRLSGDLESVRSKVWDIGPDGEIRAIWLDANSTCFPSATFVGNGKTLYFYADFDVIAAKFLTLTFVKLRLLFEPLS